MRSSSIPLHHNKKSAWFYQTLFINHNKKILYLNVNNARAMASEYPELFRTITQSDVEENPKLLHTVILKKLFL